MLLGFEGVAIACACVGCVERIWDERASIGLGSRGLSSWEAVKGFECEWGIGVLEEDDMIKRESGLQLCFLWHVLSLYCVATQNGVHGYVILFDCVGRSARVH